MSKGLLLEAFAVIPKRRKARSIFLNIVVKILFSAIIVKIK
jgi:hypothetical protein